MFALSTYYDIKYSFIILEKQMNRNYSEVLGSETTLLFLKVGCHCIPRRILHLILPTCLMLLLYICYLIHWYCNDVIYEYAEI